MTDKQKLEETIPKHADIFSYNASDEVVGINWTNSFVVGRPRAQIVGVVAFTISRLDKDITPKKGGEPDRVTQGRLGDILNTIIE